jgi:hypothetical protein
MSLAHCEISDRIDRVIADGAYGGPTYQTIAARGDDIEVVSRRARRPSPAPAANSASLHSVMAIWR